MSTTTPDNLNAKLHHLLTTVFNLTEFRYPQLEVITSVAEGYDTVTVLRTGFGKSLIYQLPALLYPGKMVLVVSPLIALMQDQTSALQKKNINCLMISSSQTEKQIRKVMEQIMDPEFDCKLLYVSPERIEQSYFQSILENLVDQNRVSAFAIDEAHCISKWGHEFRPAYSRLGYLKFRFPQLPLLALTATATEQVKKDIIDQLNLKDYNYFPGTFNRPEISYIVRWSKGDYRPIIGDMIGVLNPTVNVVCYCFSRNNCDDLAEYLNGTLGGNRARAYHAKLKASERKQVLEGWIEGQFSVICATIAFGMGIDKSNVRLVIHQTMPQNIESFYQESGRGGRDGCKAVSLLLYNDGAANMLRNFINKTSYETRKESKLANLEEMVQYCKARTCRRAYLLKHFGEVPQEDICHGTCDICNPDPFTQQSWLKELVTPTKPVFRKPPPLPAPVIRCRKITEKPPAPSPYTTSKKLPLPSATTKVTRCADCGVEISDSVAPSKPSVGFFRPKPRCPQCTAGASMPVQGSSLATAIKIPDEPPAASRSERSRQQCETCKRFGIFTPNTNATYIVELNGSYFCRPCIETQ